MSENSQYFKEITDVSNNESVRDDAEFLIVQTPNGGTGKELVRLNLADIAAALQDIIGSGGGTMPALSIKGNDTNDTRAAKNLTKADVLAMFAMHGADHESSGGGTVEEEVIKGKDRADAVFHLRVSSVDGATVYNNGYDTYVYKVGKIGDAVNDVVTRSNYHAALISYWSGIDLSATPQQLEAVFANAEYKGCEAVRSTSDCLYGQYVHYSRDGSVNANCEHNITMGNVPTGTEYILISNWVETSGSPGAGYHDPTDQTYLSIRVTITEVTVIPPSGEVAVPGIAGFVPPPPANGEDYVLHGDATWKPINAPSPDPGDDDPIDYSEAIASIENDINDISADVAAIRSEIAPNPRMAKAIYSKYKKIAQYQPSTDEVRSYSVQDLYSDNDITFVGDELWVGKTNNTVSPITRDVRRLKLIDHGQENGGVMWTQVGACIRTTGFDFWNVVDYCEETDSLIFSKYSGDAETGYWYFAVLENPRRLWNDLTIGYDGIAYASSPLDVLGESIVFDLGENDYKPVAVWGDPNLGSSDIVYILTQYKDSGETFNKLTKVQLARVPSTGKLFCDSNGKGRYQVLEQVILPHIYPDGEGRPIDVQGMDCYNDTLYIGLDTNHALGLMYKGYRLALVSLTDYSVRCVDKKYYYPYMVDANGDLLLATDLDGRPTISGADDLEPYGSRLQGCIQGVHVNSDDIWVFINHTGKLDVYLMQYARGDFDGGSIVTPISNKVRLSSDFTNLQAPSTLLPGNSLSQVAAFVNQLAQRIANIITAPNQVEVSTSGVVTQELAPNTVYVFTGELTSLTLTLGTPISGIANLYQAFFFNGSTAVNLMLPSGVSIGDFAPEADKLSEINIQYIGPLGQTGTQRAEYILRGDNR